MFDVIASVLAWLYDVSNSYAGAIVLLTLIVMIIVTPFTLKGTRSMIQMQRLQPEMKRIQAQYKDDRQRMNEEMMAFYREHNLNPLGGCLPLLIQMPVFIVLYQVLRGLTRRLPEVGQAMGQVGANAAGPGVLAPIDFPAQNFDPAYLSESDTLYKDLSSTNEMSSWGLDLSESAGQALRDGIVHALPYFALILVVFVSSWIQQRQIQGRNTNAQVNPQQQMIMKVMIFFLPLISFGLPAALVVYFVVSNLYRLGQQTYITRTMYGDKSALAPVAPKPREKGKDRPAATATEGTKGKGDGARPGPTAGTATATASGEGTSSSDAARKRRTTAGQAPKRTPKKNARTTAPSKPSTRGSGRVTPPGQAPKKQRKRK